MKNALKVTGIIALAIIALFSYAEHASQPNELTPATPGWNDTTTTHVEEDEPGWDCETMGNQDCGPAALPEYIQPA